jgi:hypothetical protein
MQSVWQSGSLAICLAGPGSLYGSLAVFSRWPWVSVWQAGSLSGPGSQYAPVVLLREWVLFVYWP